MGLLENIAPAVVVAIVLVVGWVAFRIFSRLTASLFRLGCFIIFMLGLAAAALIYLDVIPIS
jgi:hypothetical protein